MPDTAAQQSQGASVAIQESDLSSLLDREFKPTTDTAKDAIQSAVKTLAAQALEATTLISSDTRATIEAIVAAIDKKLSEQVNLIMHHEDFRKLEGSWRGLYHLVSHTETDEMLKIRVLNIPKKEVAKTLKQYHGTAWDQSPLFKKLYEDEFGTPGGEPFGSIIGDYEFDHSPMDVATLGDMAKIAAAAHAPFITSAAPTLFGFQSWSELSNPRDLTKIFQTPEYAAWRSLRESDDSKYVGMAMPRFLSRLPYGAKTSPVDEFDFEEEAEGKNDNQFVWANAAYAMGTNITRAFKTYGWCATIRGVESGGAVEGLPVYTFPTDDGGVDMKCPTEIAITDRREAELAKNGMMPLSSWKNTDFAVFVGAQSLNKPQEYDNPDATANANLASRLPYMFATCRFAHYLKCIVRDKIGSYKSREEMSTWLNNWIMKFVNNDPNATDETKAKFPLSEARIDVEEVEGNPGYYSAKVFLKPHYQLEGLTVSLRLTTKLPAPKK
jgi:type VI secretion system protein ImpC